MTFQVVLGELTEEAEQATISPAQPEESSPPAKEGKIATLGLTLSEMSAGLRERYSLDEEANGVVVTGVDQAGTAAEKGLKPGDVIVEVDQQAVSTPAEVEKRVKDAKNNGYRVVTLLVYREGDFQWVALRIDKS
jgi:serine protease Do